MAILTVGQVGLDVELGHPSSSQERNRLDGTRELKLKGFLKAPTSAETTALRQELLQTVGDLITMTYTLDTSLNAFYVLESVQISSEPVSYLRNYWPFELNAIRLGTESKIQLQSLLSGSTVTNVHSVVAKPVFATPPGALAVNLGPGTSPTEFTRKSEDGDMGYYFDIPDFDPTWSIDPLNYYKSAVTLTVGGRVRSGTDFPNTPESVVLSNGIMEITCSQATGVNDGELDVRWHDGTSWSTAIPFNIYWTNTTAIPEWHYVSAVRVGPEMTTLKLVRDADTTPPSAYRHELDITLRRGLPIASCVYTYTGAAATHSFGRIGGGPDGTTTITGGGGIQSNTLASGNRWVIGTPDAFGVGTDRLVASTASRVLKFMFGTSIDDKSTGVDAPQSLMQTYIGFQGETTRAVRR